MMMDFIYALKWNASEILHHILDRYDRKMYQNRLGAFKNR